MRNLQTLKDRLTVLERIAERENDAHSIWVEMDDCRVKEVANFGKEIDSTQYNFPTINIAATFVENIVNESANVAMSIFITDILAFFAGEIDDPNMPTLLQALLPGEKICSYITVFKNTDTSFNFKYSVLYSVIRGYFNTCGFHVRYRSGQYSEHDNNFFNAMLLIYQKICPENTPENIIEDFSKLVYFAGKLDGIYRPSDN